MTPKPDGKHFGEWCQTTDGRKIDKMGMAGPILVETTKGKDESGKAFPANAKGVHSHPGDIGHPRLINCASECKRKGKAGSNCVIVASPNSLCAYSAKCDCR